MLDEFKQQFSIQITKIYANYSNLFFTLAVYIFQSSSLSSFLNNFKHLFFVSNDPGEIRTHLYGLGDHCSIQMNYRVVVN